MAKIPPPPLTSSIPPPLPTSPFATYVPSPVTFFLSQTMVSSKKRKRTHVEIRSNIPLRGDAVVTRVEVSRKTKQRVRVKSSQVSVPITNPAPSEDTPSETPDPILPTPNDPSSRAKKGRKGISHSVAVCLKLNSSAVLRMLTDRIV